MNEGTVEIKFLGGAVETVKIEGPIDFAVALSTLFFQPLEQHEKSTTPALTIRNNGAKQYTKSVVLDTLGPTPTIAQVARFLNESTTTTWRRVKDQQLLVLGGRGPARISLESLLGYLNNPAGYELSHKRGAKPGHDRPTKGTSSALQKSAKPAKAEAAK